MVADICLTSNIPYIEDVLGTSQEEVKKFKSNYQRFLVNILSADDEQPITLVEGQRDDVCKGCATGNHCETPKEERLIRYYFRRFTGDVVETTAKELRECVSEHLQWRKKY